MKKVLLCMAAMLVLMSKPCFAQEMPQIAIIQQNIKSGCIELELTCENEDIGSSALMRVYSENKEETLENLVWADETRVDNEGKIKFALDMQYYDSGDYNIYIGVDGIPTIAEKRLQYFKYSDIMQEIENIKKNSDVGLLKNAIEKYGEYLKLDTDVYISLGEDNTQLLHNILCCGFQTPEEFAQQFNITSMLTEYIGADSAAAKIVTEKVAKAIGIYDTELYADYISDEGITQTLNDRLIAASADNYADKFMQIFKNTVILEKLGENTQLWSGYEALLKKYAEIIELDFTKYNRLKKQSAVINAVIAKHSKLDDITALKESFNAAVSAQTADETYSSDSGGGGGGSNVLGGKVSVSEVQPVGSVSKAVFSDMNDAFWAKEAIEYLAEREIVNGKGNGSFAPNDKITRAEFVKILVAAFNITGTASNVFEDVQTDDWYCSYVYAAYNSGVINGTDAAHFSPQLPVTRQDAAVMLARVIKEKSGGSSLTFADKDLIADYAYDAVAFLVSKGILNGTDNNCFEPSAETTRAQAAKMIFELIKTGV